MIANNIFFVHRFLTSLFFTDAIETVALIVLLRYVLKNRILKISEMVFAGLYASFSTISYVWFVFPFLVAWPPGVEIWFAEGFAFVVEAVFYRWMLKLDWRTAFYVSLICNALSYFLGPILRTHGIWLYW